MSRRLTILALSLAACSFEGAASGPDPDPTDGGLVDAQGTIPDAAAVDAAETSSDGDGDGIEDDEDNCPDVANADQGNEDGDSFGNACDRCPAVDDADTEQLDDDGDGIGNDCDPQPNLQNSLVFFEGFDSALAPDEWTDEDNWSLDPAAGILRRENNTERVWLSRVNVGGDDKIQVVAAMSFDNENEGGANFRFGGVFAEGSSRGQTHHGCWLVRHADNGEWFNWIQSTQGGGPVTNGVSATPVAENETYVFSQSVDGTDNRCQLDGNQVTRSVEVDYTANFSGDDVGVVASFVTANLYYIYAIRLL